MTRGTNHVDWAFLPGPPLPIQTRIVAPSSRPRPQHRHRAGARCSQEGRTTVAWASAREVFSVNRRPGIPARQPLTHTDPHRGPQFPTPASASSPSWCSVVPGGPDQRRPGIPARPPPLKAKVLSFVMRCWSPGYPFLTSASGMPQLLNLTLPLFGILNQPCPGLGLNTSGCLGMPGNLQ